VILSTYKGYTIRGIDDNELKKELLTDIYKMRHMDLAKGDIVIDIRAFNGETAIVFADAVGKTGKVYAFEPNGPGIRSWRGILAKTAWRK